MKLSVVFEYLDKATAPMARTERQFGSLGKAISQASACMFRLNQSADFLQRMGDTMNRLMQPGVEFQQSMADLSSITGIVGKDLERLGGIARKTGVSSGLGARGAADAFALLASQIDVSKIGMDGLIGLQNKTITLAQASGMSMADAAMSMAGTINQFGLQANEAGRVINVLAAGSKYGAAEIPQLAESFKVVGAAANAAGLSVESTAGAIEVLSKNNLKGAEAGTALRNVVLKMQTAMGVDFRKTSLQDALIKLKPHIQDAAYMSKLFGMENVAAAQFLVANTDLLKEMTDRVTDTNVALEQAAIRTDTWSQRAKVQIAQFNDWAIGLQQNFGGAMYAFQLLGTGTSMLITLAPIGKMFTGIGRGAWNAGLGIIQFGRTLKLLSIARNTQSAFGFARAVASCGTMGRVAAVGINLWSKVTKAAGLIQGGFMKVLRGLRTVMMTSVLPSLTGVISATWAWTAALLANPITWIVLAVGALVTAVVVCWQKFAGFRAVILTIWDSIKGFGMAIFNYLVTPLKVVWKIFSGLGRALVKLFTGDFKGAAEEFTGAFKDGFKEGVEGFKKTINGVKGAVGGISGNYEMHLKEERAKQEKKEEREKAGNIGISEFDIPEIPAITVPEAKGEEGVNPGMIRPSVITVTDTRNPEGKRTADSGNKTSVIRDHEVREMPVVTVPEAKEEKGGNPGMIKPSVITVTDTRKPEGRHTADSGNETSVIRDHEVREMPVVTVPEAKEEKGGNPERTTPSVIAVTDTRNPEGKRTADSGNKTSVIRDHEVREMPVVTVPEAKEEKGGNPGMIKPSVITVTDSRNPEGRHTADSGNETSVIREHEVREMPVVTVPEAKEEKGGNPGMIEPSVITVTDSRNPEGRHTADSGNETSVIRDHEVREMPVVTVPEAKEEKGGNPGMIEPSVITVTDSRNPEVRHTADSGNETSVIREHEVREVTAVTVPEIKDLTNLSVKAMPNLEKQVSSITNSITNDNRQTAITNSQAAKIEMKFQPNISISADLTQKTKNDLITTLRGFGDEITRIVEEVQRRNGRGAYAIS